MAERCALVSVLYDGAQKCNHSRLEILIPQMRAINQLLRECAPYIYCITDGFYLPGNAYSAMIPLNKSFKVTRVRDSIRMMKRHYLMCFQTAADNTHLNYRSPESYAYSNLGNRLLLNLDTFSKYKICTSEVDSICSTMAYAGKTIDNM